MSIYKNYRYNWALALHGKQRKINLLYKICANLIDSQKMVIYQIIKYKEEHLESLETLNMHEAYQIDDKRAIKRRYDKQRKQKELIRRQGEMELYRQATAILRNVQSTLTPTEKRINKGNIRDCYSMKLTLEILIEESEKEC